MTKGKVILDFTGIYEQETELGKICDSSVSFRNLDGSRGYCAEETAEEIRLRLKDLPTESICFLDNGNMHYISFFRLEKVRKSFALAVFDHHTDMQPSALLPLLSCGNWLLESLEKNPYLQQVLLIGPPKESWEQAKALLPPDLHHKVLWIPETAKPGENTWQPASAPGQYTDDEKMDPNEESSCFSQPQRGDTDGNKIPACYGEILCQNMAGDEDSACQGETLCRHTVGRESEMPGAGWNSIRADLPLFLSIDKDILRGEDLSVNWDQGTMPFADLKEWIARMKEDRSVLGVDICGEPEPGEDSRQSEAINLALLDLLAGEM